MVNLPETQIQKSLSFAEEKALDEKISYLQDVKDGVELKDAQGVNHQVKDSKALDENLSRMKAIREAHGVQRVMGPERVELEKQEKLLREKLDPGMTWHEYMNTKRSDGMRFIRLVEKIRKWNSDPIYQRDVKTWKSIRRRLDPDDANASNVMNLFKE
jgi:hypothetical protein